jgi:hypothetical protein
VLVGQYPDRSDRKGVTVVRHLTPTTPEPPDSTPPDSPEDATALRHAIARELTQHERYDVDTLALERTPTAAAMLHRRRMLEAIPPDDELTPRRRLAAVRAAS